MRTRSTFSARARSTVATNAANWRSRWAGGDRRGPRGARRGARPRCAGVGACGGLPPCPPVHPSAPARARCDDDRAPRAAARWPPPTGTSPAGAASGGPGRHPGTRSPSRAPPSLPSRRHRVSTAIVTRRVSRPGRRGVGCRRGLPTILCNARLKSPRCRLAATEPPVRPVQGPENGTWSRRPRSCRRSPSPTEAVVPPRPTHPRPPRPGGAFKTYVDRTLNCVDCGVEFIHSGRRPGVLRAEGVHVGSQALRRAAPTGERRATEAPTMSASMGGPRGYERTEDRASARVLRRDLHVVREPGAGAVQAAHGQAGLLLGLLPRDQARLSRPPGVRAMAEGIARRSVAGAASPGGPGCAPHRTGRRSRPPSGACPTATRPPEEHPLTPGLRRKRPNASRTSPDGASLTWATRLARAAGPDNAPAERARRAPGRTQGADGASRRQPERGVSRESGESSTTQRDTSDPERLALRKRSRRRPRQTVTRPRPWTCHAPLRPTHRRVLVDAQHHRPPRRLERDQRDERLGPARRSAAGPRPRRPAPAPPASGSGTAAASGAGLGRKPSSARAPSPPRSSRRRPRHARAPAQAPPPAASRAAPRAGAAGGRPRGRRGPPRRPPGARPVVPVRDGPDEHRLDLRAERPKVLDAHLGPAEERRLAIRRRRRGRITTRGRSRPVASSSPDRTRPWGRGTHRRRRAPRVRARPQHSGAASAIAVADRAGWTAPAPLRHSADGDPVTTSQRWTMVAAILGSAMVFLDGTIMNLALPRIGEELPATSSRGSRARRTRQRLPRDPRRAADPRRRARRLLRPAADLPDRPRRLRRHVRAVRPRAHARAAGRAPAAPGRGRRAARPGARLAIITALFEGRPRPARSASGRPRPRRHDPIGPSSAAGCSSTP